MKKLLLALFICTSFFAQAQLVLQEQYPFLITEKNRLQFYGDSGHFSYVYQKLDSILFQGKGQLNILHMGGSHVQAGVLSNALREHVLSLSPGLRAHRGFLFPHAIAQTNNPRNIKVKYTGTWEGFRSSVPSHEAPWGASGITAYTKDASAKFEVVALNNDTGTYKTRHLRIFFKNTDSSYLPVFKPTAIIDTTIFRPDSGFVEYRLKRYTDTLRFWLIKTNERQNSFWLQGLQYLSDEPGVTYHAIGVNGASVKSYLRCEDFVPHLAKVKPHLVIFGIGINDAYKPEKEFTTEEFVARYDSLIANIKRASPNARFLFMTNNDSYYKRQYPNPNIYKVQEGFRQLAKNHKGAYWDLFEIMGGLNSIKTWSDNNLASKDHIHFTRAGYELHAALMFEALKKNYALWAQSRKRW